MSLRKKFAAVAVAVLGVTAGGVLAGCSDSSTARDVLEADGRFSNVEILGPGFYGCDEDHDFTTRFRATNLQGRQVEGVVCSTFGPFSKGASIRIRKTTLNR